ncbi:hypothetical protein Pan189_03460 [Stratiformator vulcanicus]|uniref:Uncharacterized protein n=1 Tax=Stratiformator vulcanicus TaxID=2527980 RepID=A0A517QWI1_9PLAN|nr:hypothetical protein Pan189_03460 [Stratiformator vulcanicus]
MLSPVSKAPFNSVTSPWQMLLLLQKVRGATQRRFEDYHDAISEKKGGQKLIRGNGIEENLAYRPVPLPYEN